MYQSAKKTTAKAWRPKYQHPAYLKDAMASAMERAASRELEVSKLGWEEVKRVGAAMGDAYRRSLIAA